MLCLYLCVTFAYGHHGVSPFLLGKFFILVIMLQHFSVKTSQCGCLLKMNWNNSRLPESCEKQYRGTPALIPTSVAQWREPWHLRHTPCWGSPLFPPLGTAVWLPPQTQIWCHLGSPPQAPHTPWPPVICSPCACVLSCQERRVRDFPGGPVLLTLSFYFTGPWWRTKISHATWYAPKEKERMNEKQVV